MSATTPSAIPFPVDPNSMSRGFPYPAKACRCDHPVDDHQNRGHCLHCGHEAAPVIVATFRDQARRTDTAGKRLAIAA